MEFRKLGPKSGGGPWNDGGPLFRCGASAFVQC